MTAAQLVERAEQAGHASHRGIVVFAPRPGSTWAIASTGRGIRRLATREAAVDEVRRLRILAGER